MSTYDSVNKAFENTVRWLCVLASVFPRSTFNKVGERTVLFWYRSSHEPASVAVGFEGLQFSDSKR